MTLTVMKADSPMTSADALSSLPRGALRDVFPAPRDPARHSQHLAKESPS